MTNGHSATTLQRKNGRLVWIDFLRFFASLAIMWFHFPFDAPIRVWSGGLYVEYFFILSGYFAISYMKKNEKAGLSAIAAYARRMYMRLLPFVIVGAAITYSCVLIKNYQDSRTVLKSFMYIPFEILLLQCSGIYKSHTIYWYLSIMMFCLPIIMYCYLKYKDIWRYLVVMIPIILYGILIQRNGTIRVNDYGINVWTRGIAGLMLGALVYNISNILRSLPASRTTTISLSLVEIISILLFICATTIKGLNKTPFDANIVFLLFCSISIALSGKTITSYYRNSQIGSWFANISLSVYCLHWPIFRLLELIDFTTHNERIALGSAITLILSVLLVRIINCTKSAYEERR